MTMFTTGLSQHAIASLAIGTHTKSDVTFTLGMQGTQVSRVDGFDIYRYEKAGSTLICTFGANEVLASKVVVKR